MSDAEEALHVLAGHVRCAGPPPHWVRPDQAAFPYDEDGPVCGAHVPDWIRRRSAKLIRGGEPEAQ